MRGRRLGRFLAKNPTTVTVYWMLTKTRAAVTTAALALTLSVSGCGSATVIDTRSEQSTSPHAPVTPGSAPEARLPDSCAQFVTTAKDLTARSADMFTDLSSYPQLIGPVMQAGIDGNQMAAQELSTKYQTALAASSELGGQVADLTANLRAFGDTCKSETTAPQGCLTAVADAYAMREAYNGTLPEVLKYTDLVVAAGTAGEERDPAKSDAVVAQMGAIAAAVKTNAPKVAAAVTKSNTALEGCVPQA